jgi:hypothetical protein
MTLPTIVVVVSPSSCELMKSPADGMKVSKGAGHDARHGQRQRDLADPCTGDAYRSPAPR